MFPNGNGSDETESITKPKALIPMNVSTSQRELLPHFKLHKTVNVTQKTGGFVNFGPFPAPSATFRSIADDKDELSRKVFSSKYHELRKRINESFPRKIGWESLRLMCMDWIRNPMNMAFLAWVICVGVSGAILFLVMTGMLNRVIRTKSERDVWFEVNNQILNALFTLMCLYQHPRRCYHLILLCRWTQKDITKLRKIYCKDGTYKPHEWVHTMVVVLLLQISSFSQYALCGLNLGYRRSQRPAVGVGICISFAIGAPAFAGIYSILSPLGKDYVTASDEESQIGIVVAFDNSSAPTKRKLYERRLSFASDCENGVPENQPKWRGGVLDFWDDIYVAYISLFCTFCVFGWNMERLGFGNMYVHITTFILFCVAPFWIFSLAAVNVDNESARELLPLAGIALCLSGLFYGGFWRIQMRKRFNLPEKSYFCGNPSVTDCSLWLFCCCCSLAQEVRTGNAYEIVDEKLCAVLRDTPTPPAPSPLLLPHTDALPPTPIRAQGPPFTAGDDSLSPPMISLMQK